ncbi:Integrin alpha N-terminal [Apiospora phragmitis]|uniref:Integrin alpha N-terminal n=1 Tax=Apiospora phragmitis TaxID=2905665 RepID=A0ABR1WQZ7_9PEZI
MARSPAIYLTLYLALGLWSSIVAFPTPQYYGSLAPFSHNLTDLTPVSYTTKRASNGNTPQLRILSLGASIVWGTGSSNGNGFRKPLRDQLRYWGYDVNMVGSRNNGEFKDNDVEATNGLLVDGIHSASRRSYGYNPNVVIINGGTNDCIQNIDVANIGGRMESLITDFWTQEGMGDTWVLLTALIATGVDTCIQNVDSINSQYSDLVDRLRSEGRKIDFHTIDSVVVGDLVDNIHPNDYGFSKMAASLAVAIDRVANQGTITEAAPMRPSTPDENNTCDKKLGSGQYAGALTQRGSGLSDGTYQHSSLGIGQGHLWSHESAFDQNQFFFARLWTAQRDDLLAWYRPNDDADIVYVTWKNDGGYNADGYWNFRRLGDMPTPTFCRIRGVHWADFNGDGLDDFACISPNGDLWVSINKGDGTADRWPSFKVLGKIKENVGFAQDRVRLADIDGDGRTDYCVIQNDGALRCYRNGWVEDFPEYWQDLGVQFSNAENHDDIAGVRFEDINGDGRDDWMWVSEEGQIVTFTNNRDCTKGIDGSRLPYTHRGMIDYANEGRDVGRHRIHLARITGGLGHANPSEFLPPLKDYVWMEHVKEGDKHKFYMRVWQNVGGGATKMEADGDKYCNMMGHENGMMDYIWTLSTGEMTIYPNAGKKSITDPESFWGPSAVIWTPPQKINRRQLHLTDWDGDGSCDIVWVNEEANNHVEKVWINQYKRTGSWDWQMLDNPADQLSCSQRNGPALTDLAVRFADITGDGRGDYLCLEKDGRVTGFIREAGGDWRGGQIKFSEKKDRANLRWADINGDGRDDMIWINKYTGDGEIWYNNGLFTSPDPSGSLFHWLPQGILMAGNVQGACIHYPDLDGDGRADLHSILSPQLNTAETWFNLCPESGGGSGNDQEGDDGEITNPNLPDAMDQWQWFDWRRRNFVAYGDSYSAGIGAGETLENDPYDSGGDCSKTDHSHVQYLADANHYHVACTGAKLPEFYFQNPQHASQPAQWSMGGGVFKREDAENRNPLPHGWSIVSFGGNDVGVLRRAGPVWKDTEEECENIDSPANIFCPIASPRAPPEDLGEGLIVVTGYQEFFNAETEECHSFGLGKELTRQFRNQLNTWVKVLNTLIYRVTLSLHYEKGWPGQGNPGYYHRYKYIDTDTLFAGHRFCEPGDGGTGNPIGPWSKAWFFQVGGPDMQPGEDENGPAVTESPPDPDTCDPNAAGEAGEACRALQELQAGDVDAFVPIAAMKAFHPKSIGHDAIARYIFDSISAMPRERPNYG